MSLLEYSECKDENTHKFMVIIFRQIYADILSPTILYLCLSLYTLALRKRTAFVTVLAYGFYNEKRNAAAKCFSNSIIRNAFVTLNWSDIVTPMRNVFVTQKRNYFATRMRNVLETAIINAFDEKMRILNIVCYLLLRFFQGPNHWIVKKLKCHQISVY